MSDNLHAYDDTENLPNISTFSNATAKKSRKDLFTDAMEGATVTFANAVPKKQQANNLSNKN